MQPFQRVHKEKGLVQRPFLVSFPCTLPLRLVSFHTNYSSNIFHKFGFVECGWNKACLHKILVG